MTTSMYVLLLLMVLLANLPFLTQKVFGVLVVKKKHFGFHLIEIFIGLMSIAVIAWVLESRSGSVHNQSWEFYTVLICLYVVFAFPAFVWRYFWQGRDKE